VIRAVPLLLALVALGCGDTNRVLAALGVPDAQDELVQACCDCLEANTPQGEDEVCDDGDRKCLCDDDAETCFIRLQRRAEPVEIVGGCTLAGGACEATCKDVLIFEPEPE
jgi:hypothetical protein